MTSSCCTKRSCTAVPHSILRDAIGTSRTGKPANPSSEVTLYGNFLARKDTQPALLLGVITATPREKVELEIFSRAVQRVSHHFDAPRGPSASGGSPPITATPCEKIDTVIISKAVQRVSCQSDAPSGPSPGGGSLSFTCQPTGEMHSTSLRFQGSPLVPPSLGGAINLGRSCPPRPECPL